MTIPISRAEVDFAEGQASTLGMIVVDKEIIPPATTDYAPFATKLKAAKTELGVRVGAVGDAIAHL